MTPDERQMIAGLFDRLRQNAQPDRDREAEALIRDSVGRDPAAAYSLVQLALVQEHTLRMAEDRIRELEQAAAAPAPAPQRSFLSGLMPSARGSVPATAPRPGFGPAGAAMPAGGFGAAPYGAAQPGAFGAQAAPRGGSFLRTALATAAGVAGGALLFEGMRGFFGGGAAQAATPGAAAPDAAAAGPWGGQHGGAAPAGDPWSAAKEKELIAQKERDAGYADAGYDDAADDSSAMDDGGGGDDWSAT